MPTRSLTRSPSRLPVAMLVVVCALVMFAPAASAQSLPEIVDSSRIQAVIDRADRMLQDNQSEQALRTVSDGLKQSPRDTRLQFLRGMILNKLKRDNEAIEVFVRITEEHPELPEPFNNLAVMYAARGDLDLARIALERAIHALPNYALAQENLGDIYVRLAARSYERAGKMNVQGSGRRKTVLTRALLDKVAELPPSSGRRPTSADTPAMSPNPAITPTGR